MNEEARRNEEEVTRISKKNIHIPQTKEIKIRYAYISAPTNIKEDPASYESINFMVITLNEIEKQPYNLASLITHDKSERIRILGRDLYTGKVDRYGEEIYEGDIIKWFTCGGDSFVEVIERFSNFSKSKRGCKIIGNIYKNLTRKI